jgi:hypothetical protein
VTLCGSCGRRENNENKVGLIFPPQLILRSYPAKGRAHGEDALLEKHAKPGFQHSERKEQNWQCRFVRASKIGLEMV